MVLMNRVFLVFFLVSCYSLLGNLKAEETPTASPSSVKIKEKKEDITFSDLFRSNRNEAYIGVILANFIYIDPEYRFVFVKPQGGELPRITIYLDKKTGYTTMKAGKLGKGKKSMMLEGDRVAIRSFVKSGIVLADEVFLVEGDFGPKARFAKRKYTGTIGAGTGAKKEGAKKEGEKKSGGGH